MKANEDRIRRSEYVIYHGEHGRRGQEGLKSRGSKLAGAFGIYPSAYPERGLSGVRERVRRVIRLEITSWSGNRASAKTPFQNYRIIPRAREYSPGQRK